MKTPLHLEDRVRHLDELGVRAFDAPAFSMIEALLSRAESMPDAAGERLRVRAAERLRDLETRFAKARDTARAQVARLQKLGVDPDGRLLRALEKGELRRVSRAAARYHGEELHPGRSESARVKERLTERLGARFAERARSSAPPSSAMSDATTLAKRSDVDLLAISELLYKRRFDRASARTTVTREMDALPDEAGVYHAASIAARALARLEELSPSYLRARLAHLAALDAAMAFASTALAKKR
jgi:hypothetical protein